MDLKLPSFDSGKLGDFKDRLGFKNNDAHRDSYDADYEDYGEYAYDDRDEEAYSDYADNNAYDDDSCSRNNFTASTPRLVTAEEVRANTHYTPPSDDEGSRVSTQRTTHTVPRNNAGYGSDRNRAYSQNGLHSIEVDEQYSAGLKSLFTPTTSGADCDQSARSSRTSVANSSATDRPSMKEPTVISRHSRIMTVIKPESYEDAERVSKVVRTGDVAVLSLRNCPESLSKRVLDFSFGAACALDAHVDYVSDSVFVITRGAGLSEDEEARLRGQGLM